MPYKEIGTPQDFEQWTLLTPTDYAVSGQYGVSGYQPSPATPTHIDINLINLASAKTVIDGYGSLNVKYMRISWNESAGVISDFVFGIVADIIKPVNFLQFWNMLPDQLRIAFGDLNFTGNDFKQYLLGISQQFLTYTWIWEAYSEEYTRDAVFPAPTDAEISNSLTSSGKYEEALDALKAKALEYGATITIKSYAITLTHADYLGQGVNPLTNLPFNIYRTHLILTVNFDSDIPLVDSITARLIPLYIVAAIAVAIVVLAVGGVMFLNNLSTVKSEITTTITNNTDFPMDVKIDGKIYTIPPHSSITVKQLLEGPPDWWVTPFTIVAVGLGAGLLLYLYRKGGRGKEK